jgi:DNA-binding CsgD family transcriptional regulator
MILRSPVPHNLTRLQQALAPLCILAVAAAFVAEVHAGGDPTALSALAVVPVLAASMLRSRWLTAVVALFAMTLQAWGVAAGWLDRDAAGMQIAVYLLTLAVSALQQSRPAAILDDGSASEDTAVAELLEPIPAVITVSGMTTPPRGQGRDLPAPLAHLLTRRERDVVSLAAHGCTARQIGERLFIGERTVETHLANAYGKLGVRSKVELARLVSAVDAEDFRTGTEAPQRVTA